MTIDLNPLKAAVTGGLFSLTMYPQWVAWRSEPPTTPGGRWRKVLVNPRSGYDAKSTDPDTWADYATALDYAERTGLGVGFVVSHTDPYFFVDVDDCLTDGQWTPRAVELCQQLSGAFVEISMSGTGLHIVGVGSRPDGFKVKARDNTFDIYTQSRFIALTGFSASGDATANHEKTVQALVREHMDEKLTIEPDDWTTEPVPEWSGYTDDEELIQAALRSKSVGAAFDGKASFKDLWKCNTKTLAETYPHETIDGQFDHSRADSALCQHLAFWTGKDCARIERLFELSGLNREKWQNRPQYRWETILQVVALCKNVHKTATMPEQQLNASVAPAPTVTVDAPAWQNIQSGAGIYSDGKDTENAATFMQCWYPDGTLRFVQEQGYRFNGKVWESVTDETLKHEITIAMWSSCPKDATVSSTFRLLQKRCTYNYANIGEWPDHDTSHMIPCQNGILDVHTGELHPFDANYFTTGILPYAYDPTATCQQWEQFLWSTLEGDAERVALLQEWMGYMLVTDYTHHKAMLLVGAPRSGKGTIGNILNQLVGDSAFQGITLDGISNDAVMQDVTDKSVLFIGDAHDVSGPDRNRILDRFLSVTGSDSITITRKYKSSWRGILPGRFTIAANSIPTFFDDSGAFGNRLLILPFNRSFLGEEDHTLKSRLLSELPGICNWALEGLRRLRTNGVFTEPAISREERNEMMRQQAPLNGFIEDECDLVEQGNEFSADLYSRYKVWCAQQDTRPMTLPRFTRTLHSTLRSRGVRKKPLYKEGKTLQGFTGIKLKNSDSLPSMQELKR